MRLIDADALLVVPNVRKVSEFDEAGYYVNYIAVPLEAIVNAPTVVDGISRDDYDALFKRFRHLLESDFIRSFDEYDRESGTYRRDISEADGVAHVVRCKDCQAWGRSPYGHPRIGWCIVHGRHRSPDYFCASAKVKTDLK